MRLTSGAMLNVVLPQSSQLSLLYRYIQVHRTDVDPQERSQKKFALICMFPRKTFSLEEIANETVGSAGLGSKAALLIEDL